MQIEPEIAAAAIWKWRVALPTKEAIVKGSGQIK